MDKNDKGFSIIDQSNDQEPSIKMDALIETQVPYRKTINDGEDETIQNWKLRCVIV